MVGRAPAPLACALAHGSMPEWPKGVDCKSTGNAYGGSNPSRPTLTKRPAAPAGVGGTLCSALIERDAVVDRSVVDRPAATTCGSSVDDPGGDGESDQSAPVRRVRVTERMVTAPCCQRRPGGWTGTRRGRWSTGSSHRRVRVSGIRAARKSTASARAANTSRPYRGTAGLGNSVNDPMSSA